MNLLDLQKIVISDIDGILEKAVEDNKTLSEYLDELNDESIDGCRSSTISQLLLLDGIDLQNTKTLLSDFYRHPSTYKYHILYAYLDDIYFSCFDPKDDELTINDICNIRYIHNLDYRLHYLKNSNNDCDYDISEGHIVECTNIKFGESTIILRKLADGLRWTFDFALQSRCLLYDIVAYVKDLGVKHHNLLLQKSIDTLLDGPTIDMRMRKVSFNHKPHIDVDDFIDINNYSGNINFFDVVLGSDSCMLRYVSTKNLIKTIMEDREIRNILPTQQNLWITNAKHPKINDSTLVFFNKAKSVTLFCNQDRIVYHEDNNNHHNKSQLITRYFSKLYALYRDDEQPVLTASLS